MERYKHKENETLRISNLTYGLLRWFYNGGHLKSCKRDEALWIDQRVFGPAHAKGLIAFDGTIWYMTEAGTQYMNSFQTRDAWKEHPSRDFSHYVKIRKSMQRALELVRSREKKAG